jgi:hypothetical protein
MMCSLAFIGFVVCGDIFANHPLAKVYHRRDKDPAEKYELFGCQHKSYAGGEIPRRADFLLSSLYTHTPCIS